MAEFSLFDNIIKDGSNTSSNNNCKHNIDFETKCCTTCGLQLDNEIFYNSEHKTFSNSNTRRKFNNTSRCHIRKS